ncbi:radical SAM protein [Sphingobacterium sp. E70]|uniref:radical SAM protein n=1 Tax=Sphingobacterium sp. E70 TaxID=2853439 RepID=UPI00279638C3|nr:radical SAM protein [Sphingobacterium sp. E70]
MVDRGILEHVDVTADRSFSFEAHPANTTTEHLQILFDLGFRRLSLGIQDFDPLVQFMINRQQTFEEVEAVMLNAREIGFESINFDLIYGLPKQTQASVQDTIEKSMLLKPDRISFYSYAHVPWLKPGQRHYTEADLPKGTAKLALYNLGKKLILAQGYADIGMDHFAKKRMNFIWPSKRNACTEILWGMRIGLTPINWDWCVLNQRCLGWFCTKCKNS